MSASRGAHGFALPALALVVSAAWRRLRAAADRAAVSTRIDLGDYYKGALFEARFTHHAHTPAAFLKIPAGK